MSLALRTVFRNIITPIEGQALPLHMAWVGYCTYNDNFPTRNFSYCRSGTFRPLDTSFTHRCLFRLTKLSKKIINETCQAPGRRLQLVYCMKMEHIVSVIVKADTLLFFPHIILMNVNKNIITGFSLSTLWLSITIILNACHNLFVSR